MEVQSLDGNYSNWQLVGNIARGYNNHKSSLHLRARVLLKQLYPTLQILEEVPIVLRKNETLYLDFYLPLKKICYEVHGEQHYKFVKFYHNSMFEFLKAQKRDREKQEWCELNNISYIELPFNETDSDWLDRMIK
jgi:hypothetical protein